MEVGVSGARGLTAPGLVAQECNQQSGSATALSKSDLLKADMLPDCLLQLNSQNISSFTGQSLGVSTARGNGSVIARVTPNPVRTTRPRFERCCAASLTPCRITISSTSGFRSPTLVSSTFLIPILSRDA